MYERSDGRQCCGTVTIFYGYGSSSDFRQVTVPVPVPYLDHKKQFSNTNVGKNLVFLHSKLFYKEKIDSSKFHQIYGGE
jgi:hypothetical protein